MMLRRGFLPYHVSYGAVDHAFREGDTVALETFVDCGWDVNETGPTLRMRPLLRHALDDDKMRRFLLSRGADPNTENMDGITPLETAAMYSRIEVVQELLDHGGDPAKDSSLVSAAESGRVDVVKLLVSRGADVNRPEKKFPYGKGEPRTPLDAAKGNAIRRGQHGEVAEYLIAQGARRRDDLSRGESVS